MNARFVYIILVLVAFSFTFESCSVKHKKKRYINKTYEAIRKSFPEAEIQIIRDSIKVIFPNNVVFDIGSSKLKPTFEVKLIRFGNILKRFEKTNLLITGHTDNSGNDNDNLTLSLLRAKSVKVFLTNRNIEASRLFTWGLGERSPIASNETEAGRLKNRRVEFIVLYNPTE